MSKLNKLLGFTVSCILAFSIAGCGPGPNSTATGTNTKTGTTVSPSAINVSGPGVVRGTVTKEGIAGISTAGLSIKAEDTSEFSVADAPVYLDDLPTLKTKTDSKGAFELKGIPTGDHYVVSEVVESGKTLKNRTKITIAKDAPIIDLKSFILRKTGSITGMVTGADSALGIDVFVPGTSMISKTKDNGAYGIINVAEGTYKVVASKFGYELSEKTIEVKSGKSANLDIALTKVDPSANLATIKGKIVTRTSQGNEGIQGATISISGQNYVTLSDAKGEFTLANVANGDYNLQVFRTGYKGMEVAVKVNVSPKDPTTKEIVLKNDIALDSDSENGVISGVVITDTNNEPLAEAVVRLGAKFVITDSNGGFIFENVESGNMTLKFQKEGFKVVEQDVKVEKKTTSKMNVTLKKEDFKGYIAGKVIDAGENAVTSATLYIVETGETKLTNPVDGTFKIMDVKAGTYTFLVTSPTFQQLLGSAKFAVEVKDKNVEGIIVTLYSKLNPDTDMDKDGIKNGSDSWPYDPTNDSVLPTYPLDPTGDADGDKTLNSADAQPFDPTNDSISGGVTINTSEPLPSVIPSVLPSTLPSGLPSTMPSTIPSNMASSAASVTLTGFSFDPKDLDTTKGIVSVGGQIVIRTIIEYAPIMSYPVPSDTSNSNIEWSSSNESVVIVNSTGVITGISKGTATITAKAKGNISEDKRILTKQITVQ